MTTPAPKAHAAAPFQGRPFALEPAPPLPSGMASMMKPAELDLLFSLAKNAYRGHGVIVDAGIFLGASTYCFAEGCRANPQATRTLARSSRHKVIHSFERALVTQPMRGFQRLADKLGEVGTDYGPYLRSILAPYDAEVALHLGDIVKADWQPAAIEILFLDVLKTPALMRHCNARFLPHLIPGESYVIQQDFYWHLAWWINLFMSVYQDYFEPADHAETSQVFKLLKALPVTASEDNVATSLSPSRILAHLDGSPFKGGEVAQYCMSELATVNFILQTMGARVAELRFRDLQERFGRTLVELSHQPAIGRALRGFNETGARIEKALRTPGVAKVLV